MVFEKITESDSPYRNLDKMTAAEILSIINKEDKKVPEIITGSIPRIEKLVNVIVDRMKSGGRMIYIGAGTSGRLGILDASECPPTYGIPAGLVIGVIAGGEKAITQAVEFAEDDTGQGWSDLLLHKVNSSDVVIGISASGTAPYVVNALEQCRINGITTAGISCNPESLLSSVADHPIEIVVGPEIVTGSTRMKAGTAQKLVLNMISTSVMILLGNIEDNKMVNMQLTNNKLVERGVKMIMEKMNLQDHKTAEELLLKYGSVKKMIENYRQ